MQQNEGTRIATKPLHSSRSTTLRRAIWRWSQEEFASSSISLPIFSGRAIRPLPALYKVVAEKDAPATAGE